MSRVVERQVVRLDCLQAGYLSTNLLLGSPNLCVIILRIIVNCRQLSATRREWNLTHARYPQVKTRATAQRGGSMDFKIESPIWATKSVGFDLYQK